MRELQKNIERALVDCSLWLHIGFIGVVALAAGLLQLFDGEVSLLSALALAFSGSVLAAASWRHARTVLEHAERASAVATDAPSDSASRPSSSQAGLRTTAMSSPIPLPSKPNARS